jgi:DNA-binding NarL/FixJ family response regulator
MVEEATAGTILIADDHPLFRGAVRQLVACIQPSANCFEVDNYPDAIAAVREHADVTLALVDLLMPGMDGFSGLAALKEAARGLRAVVVSGRNDPDTVDRALACGACAYIPKSLAGPAFIDAVKRVLAGEPYRPRDGR